MTNERLAVQFIQMLEKYLSEVKTFPNDNSKMLTLVGLDIAEWKNTC